ncbi:MAG: ACP S-malonyltransferase [Bacteroidales bacterium]|uniref:ACP S-malonyltransferase n=1 Tax=Porphyromonas sp. TaxID=1924944 RepID=UPI002970DC88|nr:ACP S-malonyltransferase [Porphyromonas sp.]MDD7438784.1 ACP S-malonyltransferase [Bacteroidales bacterium]MDY3066784.1 ACP S-malonyltransferase [Porphyromonas sp.]
MKVSVFPGQGAQFVGMGKDLYETDERARQLFEHANEILGFRITDVIFGGTEEELKQTKVTQPAVFLHSYISAIVSEEGRNADMMAGHSLGEFTALAVSGALSFEDALRLVYKRAMAMQKACEEAPSTMAAILGLPDEKVEELCASVTGETVILANYNAPGQAVISGSIAGVEKVIELAKEAGAKRALPLNVSGAFHSPFMESAREELEAAIKETNFSAPRCPIYQNVDALPHSEPEDIRENLIKQLTAPVRWTQTVLNMRKDGATEFEEYGPGNVLQGLIKRII